MASGTQRVIHSDFAGVDNTKAPHLIPEGSFNELVNVRPHDGILEQTPKFVKHYDVQQIRSNSPSQLKLFKTIYDTTTEEFKYLCVSETQAWLQDIDALEQTSGTASLVEEQVEIPVMLKSLSNVQKTTVKEFDFSVDVDGMLDFETTSVGDVDGITDGTTSYDDCLSSYTSNNSSVHFSYVELAGYVSEYVKVKGKLYIPATNTNTNGVRFGSMAGAPTENTTGVWVDFYASTQTNASAQLTFFHLKDEVANYVGSGSPTDDLIHFAELEVLEVISETDGLTDSLEDVNSQCLISGFNATNALVDFPNIDDTVKVEILSPTTFLLTSTVSGTLGYDLTIARSVPIPDTDYTVYFYNETSQNYDDYNIGDTWTYTRSELPYNTNYDSSPFSFTSYGYDNYFVASDGSVLKYKDGVIKSVGYAEALKGKHVHLFANKLFISHYGGEADDSYRLRWSDFDDPDLFYKDLNVGEAGELNFLYTFTGSQQNKGITGLSSMLNRIYILFPNAVHFGTYVGGGITMFFEQFKLEQGSPFNLGFIEGHNGLYYIGQDLNFYLNNSQQILPIGEPIKDEFRSDIVSSIDSNYTKVWGFFNEKTEEVCWVYPRYNLGEALQYRMIVYNEFDNTWYYRNLPNTLTDAQAQEISCVGFTAGNDSRLLWGSYNHIYKDYLQTDCRDVDVLSDDIASSTSADYIIPDGVDVVVALDEDLKIPETVEASTITIVTKDFVYDPTHSNTLETIFMDAFWEKAKNVEVFIAARDLVSAPISYASLGTWTPESEDQQIDMLHLAGKVWRYKFVVNPQDGVNAISGFKLAGWAEDVYVNNLEQ
ncbi:hypothetical protein N9064_00675 [bacterium]|nr:hypothetical protein [bacterium]